jgi:hypothetical protein
MNERIRELLAKHVSPPNLAVDRDAQGQHTAHVTYTVSQAEMNTLLSAVVQECAEVGFDSVEDGDDGDAIMKRVHDNILSHFGVAK